MANYTATREKKGRKPTIKTQKGRKKMKRSVSRTRGHTKGKTRGRVSGKGKSRRTQKGGDDIQFPTKEKILQDIGEWNTVHCLNYKKGKVMVVENELDTTKTAACALFKLESTLRPGILYQYILYKMASEIKILLIPSYKAPEIGVKHKCLLQRIPDDAIILGSGELLKREGQNENTLYYSCMSSLYFMFIFKRLFPNLRSKQPSEREEIKKNYESKTVLDFLKKALPNETNIVFVENIEVNGTSKGADGETINTEPLEVLTLNPEDFCALPQDQQPRCLRYVTDEQCRVLERHPGRGYCSAGVDFCSNLQLEEPPKTDIPESAHVYEEKIDENLSRQFLENQGLKATANKFMMMSQAKRVASQMGTPSVIMKKRKMWP
jgi:hypothetical protein